MQSLIENYLTILKSLHENKAGGGHCGITATFNKLTERSIDVESFCKNCNICQHQNSIKKGPSELHPIPIPDRIFGMWGIDLVGPLHLTEDGSVYMIVCTEYTTRWVEAKGIPEKSASVVTSALFELIITRCGCPERILTDQGPEFVNEVNAIMCKEFSIERSLCSPYHPQTNGLTERCNQTLINILTRYVNSNKNNWE